jgi:hypothetical protein
VALLEEGVVRGWTTQRMANRLPTWSRARLEQDSVAQTIFNPPAVFLDNLVAASVQAGLDYFHTTASLSEPAFLYELSLPMDFAFDYDEHEGGRLSFHYPTVTGTLAAVTLTVSPIEPNKADRIDTDYLLPTRLTATAINTSSVPSEILAPTLIENLATTTILTPDLDKIGTVFVTISGGEQFGTRDNRGEMAIPKVIITGVPFMFGQETVVEHIPFLTNTIKKSRYDWQEIDSVEVRGVTGTQVYLSLSSGFNRDYIYNPYAVVVTPLAEYDQMLTFENVLTSTRYPVPPPSPVTGWLPALKFQTMELNSVELQRQGASERITEHEVGLVHPSSVPLTDPILDIELVPNTRWLALLTRSELLFVDTQLPHHLSALPDLGQTRTLIEKAHTDKSVNPEMRLMVDKHDDVFTETDGDIVLTTWQKKLIRPVLEVRLSCEILSPDSASITKRQFDSQGTAYAIGAAPNDGWIQSINGIPEYDPQPRISDWHEITWVINPKDLVESPFWVALFKLEVKTTDGIEETDTVLAWSLFTEVGQTLSLPAALVDDVDGLSVSANHKLIIHTATNNVHEVDLYYDYYLIDFYRNKLWFLENYDSVEVTT